MAAANFNACLEFTLRPDLDGQGPHLSPGDSGGWTAWGVTFATWLGWCQAHNMNRPTIASFQRMKQSDVVPLYRTWFWNAQLCDDWHPGIDLCVFDFGVGAGPGTSIKVLQAAVGVTADGVIGRDTHRAVATFDADTLIARLTHQDADFYAQCSGAKLFLRGWDRRNQERCVAASVMAKGMKT